VQNDEIEYKTVKLKMIDSSEEEETSINLSLTELNYTAADHASMTKS